MEFTEEEIANAAKAAHEVNRTYCYALGDFSQVDWVFAPAWQRESAINGVKGVIAGNTPEQSHESWMKQKLQEGWKYGPTKNPESKEHPCMVPYSQLSPAQRYKDTLFVTSVKGVLGL